jgi:hypothetical protein
MCFALTYTRRFGQPLPFSDPPGALCVMSLEVAVAAPFRDRGRARLGEGEFVVALSLDRDWFTPDQAKRLVDVAAGRGLLSREDDELVAEFDPSTVTVPDGFVPDESVLREQSTFERILSALTDAGIEKQEAVAAINERQQALGITIEAAAVLYARRRGIAVDDAAERALAELVDGER